MANSIVQTGTLIASSARPSLLGTAASPWRGLGRYLLAWRYRSRSRQELLNLSDEVLQDIGITRPTATFEVVKPIWMP